MSRREKVKKCFDNMEQIGLHNEHYTKYIEDTFQRSLDHDIQQGDISQVPEELYKKTTSADIIARSRGIVAGLDEILYILQSKGLEVETGNRDGERIDIHEILLTVSGQTGQILKLERTILNFIQRLCGIATRTKKYADKIKHTETFVIGTRKTMWGLWDKRAVQCGGGLTHRLGLYDAAMLKENHLKILKQKNGYQAIRNSIQSIIDKKNPRFVEVEVTDLQEFKNIAEILVSINSNIPKVIMLDHFSPVKIKTALAMAQDKNFYDKIFFEASGNINIDTIADYAETGVDVISSGALTHSVKSLDLSMLF
ncbi:MAG TPA: carboxylating nicotinate-nucleotide diphosphorylase [bacterium]|nr:carboxylating nicotinate-nucleotide diphosphorylase [bacterium]